MQIGEETNVEDILFLNIQELMILCKAAKMTRVFGITPETEASESQLMLTIHDMVEREILQKTENGFTLLEPYQTIIKNMKLARRVISIEDVDAQLQNTTFFYGEKIIFMQVSTNDKDTLRFGVIEPDEFYRELRERGFLPDPLIASDLIEIQTEEEFLEYYFNPGREKRFLGTFTLFDLDEDSEIYAKKQFIVVRHPYNYWIVVKRIMERRKMVEDVEDTYVRYNPKNFFQLLTE